MSARGRRGRAPDPAGGLDLLWSLVVIAAALIGGLAAVAIEHTSLVIALVVSVVAGILAIMVLLWPRQFTGLPPGSQVGPYSGSRRTPTPQATAAVGPAQLRPPSPPLRTDRRPDEADAGASRRAETMVQLLPLDETGHARPNAPWWDPAHGGPPAPSPSAQRVPAPDLATYMASTFIAQCPNCGAFKLDIKQGRNAWDFRCEACEYTWIWQPGTPWPPIRVRPARRRELSAPSP